MIPWVIYEKQFCYKYTIVFTQTTHISSSMEQQTNFIIFLLLLFSFTTASSSGDRYCFYWCLLILFNYVLFSHVYIYIYIGAEIVGENNHQKNGSVKLFVFGDSYVDTGNLGNSANSWKKPYGFTFPGKPAGRFSDGRVLTDFVGLLSHFYFCVFAFSSFPINTRFTLSKLVSALS